MARRLLRYFWIAIVVWLISFFWLLRRVSQVRTPLVIPTAAVNVAPYPTRAHIASLMLNDTFTSQRNVAALCKDGCPNVLVFDSTWSDPEDSFAWHPQRFPEPHALTEISDNLNIFVWVSCLIPFAMKDKLPADIRFIMDLQACPSANVCPPLTVTWARRSGPSIEGHLLDLSDPVTDFWFGSKIKELLVSYPFITGFRCGGVDATLIGRTQLLSAAGHQTRDQIRDRYYSSILRHAQAARGFNFVLLGRTVDSIGKSRFQTFAPHDVVFTSEIPCYAETATYEDLLRSETAAVRSTLLDAETARWDDLPCADRIHCSTPKPQHARICSVLELLTSEVPCSTPKPQHARISSVPKLMMPDKPARCRTC